MKSHIVYPALTQMEFLKATLLKLLVAILFFPFVVFGNIFESDHMSSLLDFTDHETLVLCDVDNTLIESCIFLGSAQWRGHVRKKAMQAGFDYTESEEILDKFWMLVQSFIPVRSVDKNTSSIIQEVKHSALCVLALTARHPLEALQTNKQLASCDIVLSSTQFCDEFSLDLPYPGLYQNGVIYCGENKKGEALQAFFRQTGFKAKKIVFIDDREEQLKTLRLFLDPEIKYTGIRFGGSDERVNNFDPKIADLQWALLPQIISDHEAAHMLSEN